MPRRTLQLCVNLACSYYLLFHNIFQTSCPPTTLLCFYRSTTGFMKDVAVYAQGPWAHLFTGTVEQTHIYDVMYCE